MIEGKDRALGPVSPRNCSDPESCFAFAVFEFKIIVSIILKIIHLKLSVNEAKLTYSCAGNSANIQ